MPTVYFQPQPYDMILQGIPTAGLMSHAPAWTSDRTRTSGCRAPTYSIIGIRLQGTSE